MAKEKETKEPAWNEREYQITVNSCAGRYFGNIVHVDEVETLFINEANVQRLIGLQAIKPYDGDSPAFTVVDGSAPPVAPGTVVPAVLTDEQVASMSREELAARGVIVREKAPIVDGNAETVKAIPDSGEGSADAGE